MPTPPTRRRSLALLGGAAAAPLLPSKAGAAEFELRFGTLAPDGTPWSDVLAEFKQRIEKDSGGRLAVKVYLNGSLGDERAMLEKMRFGQLSGGGFSTGGISTVVAELQILELPFLFRNDAEADHVMDTVLYEDLRRAMEARGLYLWIWAVNGWLDWGGKRAIRRPEDLRAGKVLMQESAVQAAMYEALGVQAAPLPVPEILSALQTGLGDTFFTSPIYGTAAQWFTQAKYWMDCDAVYQPAAVVFSKKFWDGLPADVKKTIEGYRPEMQQKVRAAVRGLDAELFAGFRENRIEVQQWTPEEREAFRRAALPSHQAMVKKGAFSADQLERVYEALAAFRSKK